MKTPLRALAWFTCAMLLTHTASTQPAWTSVASLGNAATPRYNACGMAIGTKGYIGTGFFNSNFYKDFFEYDPLANTWLQKANFGGSGRSGATAFAIGIKGYMGLGYDGTNYKNDFWEYDQLTNSWTQKANFAGTARSGATGFSIGLKGYIGTGFDGTIRKNDFWEYDPLINTWTQKANFGGVGRSAASGFAIGLKGYIGTGYDGTNWKNDFWEYDPIFNSWTQKAAFAGTARSNAVGFSIGLKGYIGTGLDGSYKNDFWEYDPILNSWIQKANFGGSGRYNATGFAIATKGYIGIGFDGTTSRYDFWEYDQLSNTWQIRTTFGGYTRIGAVSFSIDSKGYFGTGHDGFTYTKDFWQYDPLANSWTQKANYGGVSRTGAVGFSIGSKGYVGTGYNGAHLNDFWEYDPLANTWIQKTNFAGVAREEAVGFAIGSKGYVGTGVASSSKSDFWEYDPIANSWTQKTSFPGGARQEAIGFGINGLGDLSTGVDNSLTYYDDLWEFNPNSNSWSQKTDFPGGARRGTVSTIINGLAYIAVGHGENELNTDDVWVYNPSVDGWARNADFAGSARNSAIFFSANNFGFLGFGDDGTILKNDLWKFKPVNTITLPGTTICSGSTIAIDFTTSSYLNSGNVFTAQLSNENGSFGAPVVLGSLNGPVSGTISSSFPSGLAPGSNYLIRIMASNPSQTIVTSNNITINTPPQITSCPANSTTPAVQGLCSSSVSYLPATAIGSPSPSISYSQNSGTSFNAGTTNVVVTATNTCGVATCNFSVVVTDNQIPVFSGCPSNINTCSNPVTWTAPTASDNCGVASIITNHNPGETFPSGTTTVTYTATDVKGNTAACNFTVTVNSAVYTISPSGPTTFCKPGSATLTISPSANSYQWYKNNAVINGATAISYSATATGNYYCKATGSCGVVNSNTVSVSAIAAPTATVSPAGTVNICSGQTVTLSANTGAGLTYQWKKGSANISGATNSTYIASQAAQYKVVVTKNGCSKTSAATKVAVTCREDIITEGPQLTVFPNPTSGSVIVRYSNEDYQSANLQVYDLLGRVVYSAVVTEKSGDITLDLTSENEGYYFIRLITNSQAVIQKIEIMR